MGRTREPEEDTENLAEFLERLGDIPAERILMKPPPGSATEDDLLRAKRFGSPKLIELIDGVLVGKPVGSPESLLGGIVIHMLGEYLQTHNIGVVLPADGLFRLAPGLVRLPDVSFIRWEAWTKDVAAQQITPIAPDLAIEILSPSNTKREIDRKIRDLFLAGTRLVWVIQPKTQTAEVYTAPDERKRIGKGGLLDGAPVLPGFKLSLTDLFARATPPKKP
jgi:Uma2 family endonuclease